MHRSVRLVMGSVLCCLAAASSAAAQGSSNELARELSLKLAHELEQAAREFDGVMGIAVKDLTGGEAFSVNADLVFPQASSIKIPILIELYRQAQAGKLKLSERVEVKSSQMAGGDGVLQRFSDGGSAVSLRDLATLMIVLSDNTATNILIDRVGMDSVNQTLAGAGLRQTRLQRRMLDVEAQKAGRENLSTPLEMIWLLGLLQQGKLLDAQHTAAAMEILSYAKETPLRRGVPPAVRMASKDGGLAGVRCDSGIVYLEGRPYAISVMTTYGAEDRSAGEEAIAQVSRRVFAYFDRLARSNALGVSVR